MRADIQPFRLAAQRRSVDIAAMLADVTGVRIVPELRDGE